MSQLELVDAPAQRRDLFGAWRSVLIPLDGSETSAWILRRSRRVLDQPGIAVMLLRVIQCAEPRARDLWFRVDDRHLAARQGLSAMRADLARAGINVRAQLRFGDPTTEILREIDEGGHDLLVMSTHKRTWISRAFFRSVANGVLQSSRVPILLFCPLKGPGDTLSSAQSGGAVPFEHLLIPLDGMNEPEAILPSAEKIVGAFGATLHLVGAVSETIDAPGREAAHRYFDVLARALASRGIEARATIASGSVADAVFRVIRECGIDSVALMTHGRSRMSEVLQGSLAQRLIREAGVPILVLCNPVDRHASPSIPSEHRQVWVE